MRKVLLVLLAALLGASVAGQATARAPEAQQRPNILLINTDDQRADTLDVMPKLRRWFEDGRTFKQALVNIPSCCPSRATLLSGRYAHQHGVKHQADALKLDLDSTLPALLRNSGYRTAMAGKYLNSWPLNDPPPHFQQYSAIHGGYRPFNMLDSELSPDRKKNVNEYSTTWLGKRLESFLTGFHESKPDQPWFAYYAPIAPHRPWQPEPKYANETVRNCLEPDERDRSDKPSYIKRAKYNADEFRTICENSLRTLMSVDDAVDSLLRGLQQRGELDDTLVIYTSDNGYLWGEHGKDSKFVPYLPALRVPLLMRWPARVTPGDDGRLTSTIDIVPTALDAAGASVPGNLVGLSLLGETKHEAVFSEYFLDDRNGSIPDWAASFDGRFHYIETYSSSGELSFTELYDVESDPGEDRNIAAGRDVRSLHGRLTEWRQS